VTGTDLKHRLAAILAADAAGYSRLMAADERGTVAALDAARDVFRKHVELNRGRIVDTAGDSVLAVFDTASGATSAALAIQNELEGNAQSVVADRRLLFRIGLHLGDVIEKVDGTVYGDGVNISARLQALAEVGGIAMSDSVRNAVRGKVAASFEALGEQTVKNIAEPVRAYRVRSEATATALGTPGSVTSVTEIDLSLPDKPSIAVLPFTNMSGDPEQEYFTDGVTEDIITELSRFHSLFVIARNSTFTYKGKAVDVRTVSNEMGVRYVLEGSIRRAGNRIRVTAQLIDSMTRNHIWAERYDRVLDDIFAVQEEVTRSIVSMIAPEIQAAEASKVRRIRPRNLSAYEVAVRAWSNAGEAFARTDQLLRDQAIREAKSALAIDPESVVALQALAWAQWQNVFLLTAVDLHASWTEAMEAIQRSISIDGSDGLSYAIRGILFCFAVPMPRAVAVVPQYDEAISDLQRAHELNSNDAFSAACLGYCEAVSGQPHQGIEHLALALRTNPKDPGRARTLSILSMACFLAKDYGNGIRWGLAATQETPRLFNVQTFLALNFVGLGDIDKAAAALTTARQLSPGYVEARLKGVTVYRRPEDRCRQTVFLRIAAGLEDPSAADAFR
jgi:adenylate cyclase